MAVARKWKWLGWLGLGLLILLVAAFVIVDQLDPLPLEAMVKPYSTLVYDRNGKLLRGFLSSDDKWRLPVEGVSVSPEFERILLAYEDRWYFWHPGVNPAALVRALLQNLTEGRVVSGGSTITMQVARLLEPKERTLANKCKEILRALQLEAHLTKREILEIYYDLAPFGGNIEGVRAASLLYFGKSPDELSIGEAALLAAIPNSPERLRPDLYPEQALAARNKVLSRALQFGAITDEQYRSALKEEIPRGRRALPFEAPHLTERVRRHAASEGEIMTTIDLELQRSIEKLLKQHVEAQRLKGITNGAVVVLDNKAHTVLALVGSVDYFSDEISGQVDGAFAPRSPGSTLKPFIYAMAIDRGLITPKMYLEDVPLRFGDYSPENYSGTFSGLVRADYALAQSLNVPAVDLLQRLGGSSLYELLRKAKVSTLADQDRYGLSIALGGAELNLFELTTLYSAFAANGKMWRPTLIAGAFEAPPTTLMSEEAAYLVTSILTQVTRPDLPAVWQSTTLPTVAWKTGTSFGYRDAWSIGYNPDYTVGVWIGNFSGQGSSELVGAEVAAPLLFRIFDVLTERKMKTAWFSVPPGIKEREVCSLSGQVPGPYCEQTVKDQYIPGVSSERKCTLHQVVWVNSSGEYSLVERPMGEGFRQIRYIKWPERTAKWLEANGQVVLRFASESTAYRPPSPAAGTAPRIVSPAAGQEYRIRGDVPVKYQKVALDATAEDATVLYWFIDGELVGSGPPGQKVFYVPSPGRHVVVCQDDRGRSTKIEFTVQK